MSSKSLAYGSPSLLVSAVRLPTSPNVVSTPLALSIAPPGHPTNGCVRNLRKFLPHLRWRVLTITSVQAYQRHHRQGKDQYRYRQFHHPSSHGKCAPKDKAVVIELQRVAWLNPTTRMTHKRNIHRRRIQIHPAGNFLIYPLFIAYDSIGEGCAMSMTADF